MYKKKNIVKKTFISIICVIVMVFSMPVKAKADVIQDLVNVLLRIPDAIMWVSNRYLADRESDEMHINIGLKGVHGVKEDDGAIYNFFITPYDIFTCGEVREYKDTNGNDRNFRNLPIFYANFFNIYEDTAENDPISVKSNEILRPVIGNIYKYLRNLCLVLMMLVLLYIGIRIMLSVSSAEQAKYKNMLIDWGVGISLLFIMHYIMSFIMNINDVVLDMLKDDSAASYYICFGRLGDSDDASSGWGEEWYELFDDHKNKEFLDLHLDIPGNVTTGTWQSEAESQSAKEGFPFNEDDATIQVDTHTDWGDNGKVRINAYIDGDEDGKFHIAVYKANLMEYVRTLSDYDGSFVTLYSNNRSGKVYSETGTASYKEPVYLGYATMYLALVVETIMFAIIYFKRLLQLAFLTMVAPLVAFMYPIDKIGDGKAQAFNTWFKDYLFNVLIQPLHLLLYTIFVVAAVDLFSKNILYALAIYAFMIVAEKYFKKMFGFDKASSGGGGPLAGAIGGGMAMSGLNKLTGLGPPSGGGGGKGSGKEGGSGIKLSKRKPGDTTNITNKNNGKNPKNPKNPPQTDPKSGPTPNSDGGKSRLARLGNSAKGILGSGAKMLGRGATKVATGGKFDRVKNQRVRDVAKAVGGNIARKAIRGATTLGMTAAGLVAGGATAIATGDVNNLFKGASVGVAAGLKQGKAMESFADEKWDQFKENHAETDENYRDNLRIEEARKSFQDTDFGENKEGALETVDKYAPYVDLNGDEGKVKGLQELDKTLGGKNADNVADVIELSDMATRHGNVNNAKERGELEQEIRKNNATLSDVDVKRRVDAAVNYYNKVNK